MRIAVGMSSGLTSLPAAAVASDPLDAGAGAGVGAGVGDVVPVPAIAAPPSNAHTTTTTFDSTRMEISGALAVPSRA